MFQYVPIEKGLDCHFAPINQCVFLLDLKSIEEKAAPING